MHEPPQQIQALPLHAFPSVTGVPVSMHVGRPASHVRAPTSQGLAGVQLPLAAQPPLDEAPPLEPALVVPVTPPDEPAPLPVVPVPPVAPAEDETPPPPLPVLAAAVVPPPLDAVIPEPDAPPPVDEGAARVPVPSPVAWTQPARSSATAHRRNTASDRDIALPGHHAHP